MGRKKKKGRGGLVDEGTRKVRQVGNGRDQGVWRQGEGQRGWRRVKDEVFSLTVN